MDPFRNGVISGITKASPRQLHNADRHRQQANSKQKRAGGVEASLTEEPLKEDAMSLVLDVETLSHTIDVCSGLAAEVLRYSMLAS